MKPDFNKKTYYAVEVMLDGKLYSDCKCFMNEKAWNKTIENGGHLWEYIPDNGRVIERLLPLGMTPDMTNAVMNDDDHIIVNLIDTAEQVKQTPLSDLSNDQVLAALETLIRQRKAEMPPNSYTTHLFEKGEEKILKKMGEECIEVILAKDNNKDIIYESADLIYHLMVYLVYKNIPFNDILEELKSR